MTLREGNIFSRICLSVISVDKGSHVVITHDALKITIQRPLPPAAALPSPVLSGGGTYSWQAGNWHTTGMLSCCVIKTSNRFLTTSILLSECEIPNDITV